MSSSFIYIDSSDRLFGSPSNFKVDIQDLNSNNEKDISLNTLSINKSFYSINNNNHSFLFGTTGITGATGTTNLTNGNYNSTQFCTELNTQLNSFPLGITFASSWKTNNCFKRHKRFYDYKQYTKLQIPWYEYFQCCIICFWNMGKS